MYNTEIRNCGWDNPSDQGGVALVNVVSDDGTGCVFNGHNLIVRGGKRGFYCGIGASHKMELWNCRTFDCTEAALYAISGASILTHGHMDQGSLALRGGSGAAGILAVNGTLVT
jgi:hypothetical protein